MHSHAYMRIMTGEFDENSLDADAQAAVVPDAELNDVSEADEADVCSEIEDKSDSDDDDDAEEGDDEHIPFECPDGVCVYETVPEWVDNVAQMKKTRVAHYFSTGWEIGQIKGKEGKSTDVHFGQFYVKYKTEKDYLYHELNEYQYGADKLWVLLK